MKLHAPLAGDLIDLIVIAKSAPGTRMTTLGEHLAGAQPGPEHLNPVVGQHPNEGVPFSASEPEQTQAEDQLLICLKACEPLLELRVDSGGFARL